MTTTKTICDVTGSEEPTLRLLPCGSRLKNHHQGRSFDLSHAGAVNLLRQLCASTSDYVADEVMTKLLVGQTSQASPDQPIIDTLRHVSRNDVAGVRQQAARECIELACHVVSNGHDYNQPKAIRERISKEFGL